MREVKLALIALIAVLPDRVLGFVIFDVAMTGSTRALIVPIPATVHTALEAITFQLENLLPFLINLLNFGAVLALALAVVPLTWLACGGRIARVPIRTRLTSLLAELRLGIVDPLAMPFGLDYGALSLDEVYALDHALGSRPHA